MPHKQIAGIGLEEILYDSKLAKYNKCKWVITFPPTKLFNTVYFYLQFFCRKSEMTSFHNTHSTTTVRTVFLKIMYYRTELESLKSMYQCICVSAEFLKSNIRS